MTTRRELLRLTGAAAGAVVLGAAAACERGKTRTPVARSGERLVVETAGGLAVLAADGPVIPAGRAVLNAGGTQLARATSGTGHTEVVTHEVGTGRAVSRTGLQGILQPRVLSADGRLVALANPGNPVGSPYKPAGRSTTTIVVADASGERVRMTLPGNLEPEAFTTAGHGLFVLDYLPPAAPDRYRVRFIDLAARTVHPLQTRVKKPVPPGAEEEMRGEGRQAVYHRSSDLLFTLYTHQPDHLHTRDLLAGARHDAPHVHAFVHTLSLREQWAFCVDLPSPFGEHPPAGHAIALSPDGRRLVVVEATTGTAAFIDPTELVVSGTRRFSPPAGAPGVGTAAAITDDGRLVVGAGREVVTVPAGGAATRWSCPAAVRGLALDPAGKRVYVGQTAEVTSHDLTSGRLLARFAAPDLVSVRGMALSL